MASVLDGIADQIFQAFKGEFRDATLTRQEFAGDSPDIAFDPPAPTETEFTCKALVTKYSFKLRAEGLVQANDRKVLILAPSLSIDPIPTDRVTIGGTTFVLSEDIAIDPANAVWVCRGKF